MKRADKLILGTVQFGLPYGINNRSGMPDFDEVSSILSLAHTSGISLLDTAEAYGVSHEVIGRYHREQGHRFEVITKFDHRQLLVADNITERIDADIRALEVHQLYAYMFHSFSDYLAYGSKFEDQFKALQQAGKINKIGVSVYTNEELEQVINDNNVQLVQLPFNLLDNYSQRGKLIEKAKEKGMEVHTRSVFLQGLFFMGAATLPKKLEVLIPYLQDLKKISVMSHLSMQALALNYAVQSRGIDKVLVGTEKKDQLAENIAALEKEMSPSLQKEIDAILVEAPELLNPVNWKA